GGRAIETGTHTITSEKRYIRHAIFSAVRKYIADIRVILDSISRGVVYCSARKEVRRMALKPNVTSAPRTGRSPAYPAFGLRHAIEKVRLLYNAQRMIPVS